MSKLIPRTEFGPRYGTNYESAWHGGYLEAQLNSNVGKKRKKNEDSCIMCAPEDKALASSHGLLFAVADGMGGATAGEYASRLSLHTLVHAYYGEESPSPIPETLSRAVEIANEAVFTEAEENPEYMGMGTTMSAMIVYGDWAYLAQVGDSRIYLLRKGAGLHQITLDHSLVAEQMRSGMITPKEAKNHSLKNLITRAVGTDDTVEVDRFAVQLRKDDIFLICSDGLSGMVADKDIARILGQEDLKKSTADLIESALDAGGDDNITAVTIRVTGTPSTSELQEGARVRDIPESGILQRLTGMFS